MLSTIYYILSTIYHILYTINYILYSINYTIYYQLYLLGSLALPHPVLEVGKPDPVQHQHGHAEDEEHGDGVPPLLRGTIAQYKVGH